jgi:hypothetical protein
MKIKEWYVAHNAENARLNAGVGSFASVPPETKGIRILGTIEGSKTIKDGEFIITSSLLTATETAVVTKNNVYELGEPSEDYEKSFPRAKDRLLISLRA